MKKKLFALMTTSAMALGVLVAGMPPILPPV
jgi:hypothetical protein